MRMIMLGAPGAGKGTISKFFVERRGMVQISTGDILRAAVSAGTPIGKRAEEYMKNGDLVPDEVIMGIIQERLMQDDCKRGFLLDGFPRTIPQAEGLKALLSKMNLDINAVVDLEADEDIIINRLSSRRTCSTCQEIYNVVSKPAKVEGVCDKCGGAVVQRADETEEAIKHRLEVYHTLTEPLISYYRTEGLLIPIDATFSPQEVYAHVAEKLGKD